MSQAQLGSLNYLNKQNKTLQHLLSMRFIKFFFIIVALYFLQSCSKTSLYQSKHYVFGTIVDISIYGESDKKAEEATQAVLHEFTRLHHSLHAWKRSDLTSLNEAIAKK